MPFKLGIENIVSLEHLHKVETGYWRKWKKKKKIEILHITHLDTDAAIDIKGGECSRAGLRESLQTSISHPNYSK